MTGDYHCTHPHSKTATRCRACDMAMREAVATHICEQCGRSFHRKAHGKDDLRFCGRRCAGDNKRQVNLVKYNGLSLVERVQQRRAASRKTFAARSCAFCRSQFVPQMKTQRWCCKACGMNAQPALNRARNVRKSKHVGQPVVCKGCRREFARGYGQSGPRTFCSVRCATKHFRRVHKGVRRARKRAVDYESVDPICVFVRDGWRCQLCGCSTPLRLRGKHRPRSPELDHIVPLSRGGAHIYANTQCACRLCNAKKRGNILGQLRLAI